MPPVFPFGSRLKAVRQIDLTPKKLFVLGVYASAVHARWVWQDGNPATAGKLRVAALAVASEPRIFWDGNEEEAKKIIEGIHVPEEVGRNFGGD